MNKDRLKRLLAMSISEKESEADHGCDIAQHCWAAHLLDACKYEETRAGASILSSLLWQHFKDNIYHLVENMRMQRSQGLLGEQVVHGRLGRSASRPSGCK